jgi:hypothetical protein
MNIDFFVSTITSKPSFWARVWLFFFLLINGKEGRELVRDISAKVDLSLQKADELHEKAALLLEKTDLLLEKTAVNAY